MTLSRAKTLCLPFLAVALVVNSFGSSIACIQMEMGKILDRHSVESTVSHHHEDHHEHSAEDISVNDSMFTFSHQHSPGSEKHIHIDLFAFSQVLLSGIVPSDNFSSDGLQIKNSSLAVTSHSYSSENLASIFRPPII